MGGASLSEESYVELEHAPQEPLLQASPDTALLLQRASRSSCLPSLTTAISVLPQLPLRGRANDAGPESGSSSPFHILMDHQSMTGRPLGQEAFGSSSWPSSSSDSSLIFCVQMQRG